MQTNKCQISAAALLWAMSLKRPISRVTRRLLVAWEIPTIRLRGNCRVAPSGNDRHGQLRDALRLYCPRGWSLSGWPNNCRSASISACALASSRDNHAAAALRTAQHCPFRRIRYGRYRQFDGFRYEFVGRPKKILPGQGDQFVHRRRVRA